MFETIIESETRARDARHRRFDGKMSDTRTWELWRRGNAAALRLHDPITDTIVLIERVWSADDAIAAAFAGCLPNVITTPALFWLASNKQELRQKWATP